MQTARNCPRCTKSTNTAFRDLISICEYLLKGFLWSGFGVQVLGVQELLVAAMRCVDVV